MPHLDRKARATKKVATPLSGGAVVALPAGIEELIREISEIVDTKESEYPMASEQFDADVVVIGAGPGGYQAAIRAAQLGARVTAVEKEFLGGTCLNWGCIPSKAMIASVERYLDVKHAGDFGVQVGGEVTMDFEKMMARKDKIVQTQRGGVGYLFKKNKISHVEGFAKFLDKNTLEIEKDGKTTKLTAKNIILAMGSGVIYLKVPGLDGGREEGVWTSDDAVTAPFVPKRMLILGGGAVGVEFGYVFNGLGTEVTLVEMAPTLIPSMDEELGKELGKIQTRQGVKVKTGSTLEKVEKVAGGWKCFVKTASGTEEVEVDVVLLGVGRKAMTDNMNLEKIGIKLHRRGIEVKDDSMRTHVDNIYAIGDVTGRVQLAHGASYEGLLAVENIIHGTDKKANYKAIPNCVYTSPEVASVGLTEQEAIAKGIAVKIGKANFRPFGKPMATGHQDGFVKVVIDAKYGEVLGMHLIGAHVTDLVHEGVVALNLEATLESMVESIHGHPTMSEAILEAFEDAQGLAIHKA